MDADPMAQPLFDFRPIRAAELETLEFTGNRRLLLTRADIDAHEVLRALRRVGLSDVHDVNRPLALQQQVLQCQRERNLGLDMLQRHRAGLGAHGDGLTPV